MTVRSRIEQHLAKLSNAERQIARLVIEKYPMSALGDIKDIAKLASVSPPTITRFVRRLGFERFVDFQRAIRLEVQDTEASPLALLKRHKRCLQQLRMPPCSLMANSPTKCACLAQRPGPGGIAAGRQAPPRVAPRRALELCCSPVFCFSAQ
jgi:hypothetical protein